MLRNNLFHLKEIAFSGYSGSGKTTLVMKIIESLSDRYKVGYVKHDAHNFEMDKKGKDTYRAQEAMASLVTIHNDKKYCDQGLGVKDLAAAKLSHIDNDFVIIEGHKNSKCPKIIVLGDGTTSNKILEDYNLGRLSNVVAFVGTSKISPIEGLELPYFQRDEINEISTYVLNFFLEKINKSPIYGLVLAGGRSKRMKKDKGSIKYYDQPQTQHVSSMLNKFCENVFVSCREEQADDIHLSGLNLIHDKFIDMGPAGGILSAMKEFPEATWLVVACDLPYIDDQTIEHLIDNRNPFRSATCFINPIKKWPEPLCTIYEHKAFARFMQFISIGHTCPRKILFNSHVNSIELINKEGLTNANTPEDFKNIKNVLNNNGDLSYASEC
jgi:molybdopterin-guanine dinucleotide biosynthesis protein MobB